jgi:hypothetical protein
MRDHPLRLDRRALATALVVLAGWGAAFAFVPRTGFWSGDNGCKYIQMEEILRSGWRRYSISWPGRDLDPELAFLPIREPFGRVVGGELYLQYSPVFATASSAFHRALGFPGIFLLPFLAGLLTLPAVWRLARLAGGSTGAAPLAVLLAAFATPLLFYSLEWWEMAPGVCLATWGTVHALEWVRAPRRASILLAAAFCALAVYFRDEMVVFAAGLGAAMLAARRSGSAVTAFAATFAVALVPLGLFQWIAVGSAFGRHVGASGLDPASFLPDRAVVFENLFLGNHETRWISAATGAVPVALFLAAPRLGERAFARAVPILAAVTTVLGLWLLSGHLRAGNPVTWLLHANGLFSVTPFALLGFVRAPAEGDPERLCRTLRLALLFYALGYVAAAPVGNSEGIHWGCRFLLAVYPGFAALAAVGIARWWALAGRGRALAAVPVAAAVALSIVFQLHSVRLLHHRQTLSARLNDAVLARPEPVVVATGWPVPQELYRVFHEKPIFLLRDPAHSARLRELLREGGHGAAVWVAWPPRPGPAGGGRQIVDDPASFPSFEISSVSLAP